MVLNVLIAVIHNRDQSAAEKRESKDSNSLLCSEQVELLNLGVGKWTGRFELTQLGNRNEPSIHQKSANARNATPRYALNDNVSKPSKA